jgi:antitoxin component of RelBE/YafQ-DinJ toxin-antitoxin module
VTAKTLRLRARQGKLAVYRPGKAYLASLSGVRVMIGKTRVLCAQERAAAPVVPNSLGLTESDLANMRLKRALENLRLPAKEAKRLRDEERARAAPAHRLEMQERRRERARAKYREKKADRTEGAPE